MGGGATVRGIVGGEGQHGGMGEGQTWLRKVLTGGTMAQLYRQ